ncbi:hypothetical protein BJ878DRAFT_55047 [Calycina marina]|uniref:Uncharacterized protein n=1 Tax=Calycina marina TaxID=1763456 RepID=A0A9P7ZA97_9HELO|nr:hypothetical protein BJ878DRAFT_55047 [Calycina marina]
MSDIPEFVTWETENRSLESEEESQQDQRRKESSALNGEIDSSNDGYNEVDDYDYGTEDTITDLARAPLQKAVKEGHDRRREVFREESIEFGTVEVLQTASTNESGALLNVQHGTEGGDIAVKSTGSLRTLHNRKPGEQVLEEIPSLASEETEEEEHPDFVAPPSSQPRPQRETEDMDVDEQSGAGGELPRLSEQILEILDKTVKEFNVSEDMEDLAWTMAQAPPKEVENLRRVSIGLPLIELADEPIRRELGMQPVVKDTTQDEVAAVEEFVEQHPLLFKTSSCESEHYRAVFEKEVYAFAKSRGMKRNKAKVEVGKARAIFKRRRKGDVESEKRHDIDLRPGPLLREAVDVYPGYDPAQPAYTATNAKKKELLKLSQTCIRARKALEEAQNKTEMKAVIEDRKRKRPSDDVEETTQKPIDGKAFGQSQLSVAVHLATSSDPVDDQSKGDGNLPKAFSSVPSKSEDVSVWGPRPEHMSKSQWKKHKKAQKHIGTTLQKPSNLDQKSLLPPEPSSADNAVISCLTVPVLQHEESKAATLESSAIATTVEQKSSKKRATPKKRNKNRLSATTDVLSTSHDGELPAPKRQQAKGPVESSRKLLCDTKRIQQATDTLANASTLVNLSDSQVYEAPVLSLVVSNGNNDDSNSTKDTAGTLYELPNANTTKPKRPRGDRGRRTSSRKLSEPGDPSLNRSGKAS